MSLEESYLKSYKFWLEVTVGVGSVGNIAGNMFLAEKLAGTDFLKYWNTIQLLVGVTQLGITIDEFVKARQLAKQTLLDSQQPQNVLDDFEHLADELQAKVGVLGSKSALFGKSTIMGINGFIDNLSILLATYKFNGKTVSIPDFKSLINKSTLPVPELGLTALTQAEIEFINTIRNAIPMPNSNTIMQKVMPISYKDAFFVSDGNPKSIGGYMTTAKDAKHLDTYQEIFDGMRLDYAGSDFVSSNATECLVVRFKSEDFSNLNIPRNKNNGGVLNDPSISDSYNKNSYPFTGHGFTSGKNGTLGVPEWKADFGKNLILEDGAEMFIIKSDGTETLIGKYNKILNKFVEI